MADDIVTRLRTVDEFSDAIGIMDKAADEIERLRAALAIAAGMISTLPQYEDQHPQTVMEMLLNEADCG